MKKIRIRDGKNSDPGSVTNMPDPQHCLFIELYLLGFLRVKALLEKIIIYKKNIMQKLLCLG
jgi:hypothetical protein